MPKMLRCILTDVQFWIPRGGTGFGCGSAGLHPWQLVPAIARFTAWGSCAVSPRAFGWVRRKPPRNWSTAASLPSQFRCAWWPGSLRRDGPSLPCSKEPATCFADLFARKHLIVWAILAGALWAVANTLTVFAIRDVGLATAFPLWNTNSLIGLLWGVLLFRELRGAGAKNIAKVVCGAVCIVGCGDHAGLQHDAR